MMKFVKQAEAGEDGAAGGGGAAVPATGAAAADANAKTDDKNRLADAAGEIETTGDKTIVQPPAGAEKPAAPAGGDQEVTKRFSEVSKARERAERERDQANQRLSQALEAVERLTGKVVGETAKKAAEEDPEPAAPEFKDPEQFQRDSAEYARKLAERTSRVAVKAAMAEEQKKRVEELASQNTARVRTEFQKRRLEAIARLPDYQDVAENPELPITDHMASALITDAIGPDIAYYLGKPENRAECERIAALPSGQQLIEIGVLKARVSGQLAAGKKTAAPPPIKPAGPGSSTTKSITDDSTSMDEYAAKREADLRAAKRPGAR